MKSKTFTLALLFLLIHFTFLTSSAQVCDCSDEDSGLGSGLTSSDGFESYNSGVRLPSNSQWSVFPSEPGYSPVSGTVVSSPVYCGSKSLRLQNAGNYEDILYSITGWRTSFELFIPSGKSAQIAYLNNANKALFFVLFNTNGTAKASASLTSSGSSFTFKQNSWQRFSVFSTSKQWLIFLGNDHVATIDNVQGATASKLDLFAQSGTDLFYIDKLCHLSPLGLVTCSNEFAPVCLNKSNIQVGTNDCWANTAGFLTNEFHLCTPISGGSACDNATPISCGQTISSSTIGETYKFYRPDYGSCLPQTGAPDFRAPDKVFKFTKTESTGDVGIHLWGKTKNVDLDVFLIDKCGKSWVGGGGGGGGGNIGIVLDVPPGTPNNPDISCIASGTSTIEASGFDNDFINYPNLPAGEYYIIVDGQHWKQSGFNDDAGDFDLSLTCFDLNCSNAILMQCDVTLPNQSNANGENNVSVYCSPAKQNSGDKNFLPPGSGCTGKEKVYSFIAARTGEITISLTGVDPNEDFELFLFSGCSHTACLASSVNSIGKNEVIKYNVINGNKYYIVVDGYHGTEGNFNLTIEGCAEAVNRCANTEELSCTVRHSRSTLNTANKFNKADYASCVQTNNTYDGNDIVFNYKLVAPFINPSILLWGYTGDLDLFILNNCGSPAKCVKSSTDNSRNYEYIDMTGMPEGDYYIVVDGKNASQKSDFKVSVACQPGCNDPDHLDLPCNSSVTGNTTVCESNFRNKYTCDPDYRFSGPECYYNFTAPEAGEYSFDLFAFSNNLELFILDFNNCSKDGKCLGYSVNPAGVAEKVKVTLAKSQTITVVVDGSFGDEGPFALTTTCPDINSTKLKFDVDDISCDTKGKTVQIPVRVTNFNNIRSFSMSVTVDNPLIAQINSITSPLPDFNFLTFESTLKKTFTINALSNNGVTLTDGSIAFNINATLVGNAGQSTKFTIISNPTPIKAGAISNNVTSEVPVEVSDGSACITNVTLVKLEGKVITRTNAGINTAQVDLAGSKTSSVVTTSNGNYSFSDLSSNGNYTITVSKNINAGNGIDIFDLADLQDHILTRKLITDPYKLLAADLNRDGSIDIFDLTDLQDIILTRISSFKNNTSWIFVPTNEALDANKVYNRTFRTKHEISNPVSSQSNLDFYGIKIGDLDQTADAQKIIGDRTMVESRGAGDLKITIPSMKAKKDQLIYVPVVLEHFVKIRVFQFALNWDPSKLELQRVESFNTDLPSFGVGNVAYDASKPGMLNTVWLNPDDKDLKANSKLFIMVFRVKGNIGDNIPVTVNNLKALEVAGAISPSAINGQITVADISTTLDHSVFDKSQFEIYPNPSSHRITISSDHPFDLLQIIDMFGKQYPLNQKGNSKYSIDLDRFSSGVYFIQTLSQGQVDTQRFMVSK